MEDRIQKDNKKALPKFMAVIVTAALIGGVLGFLASLAAHGARVEAIPQLLTDFLRAVAPYLIPAIWIPVILIQFLMEKKVRAMLSSWDGEDEDIPEQIDRKLDILLTVHNVAMGLGYLAFSIEPTLGLSGGPMSDAAMFLEFIVMMAVIVYVQKRTVDLSRTLNPEKQGSVFDMKFCEKWNNSCDEAEKKIQGEASFKTFLIMNRLLISAWAVLFFLNMLFPIGFMAFFLVLGIWIAMQLIFNLTAMKLSRHK